MQDNTQKPLIVLTNDDGVDSPGLLAVYKVLHDVADLVVSAPLEQSSAAGTSKPPFSSCRIIAKTKQIDGQDITFYGIDGSPLQSVQHGIVELAPRIPDLVISGINYGENIGASIIVSGTLGAAMEAAVMGVPALAISLECSPEYYYEYSQSAIDFSVAAHFTRKFALQTITNQLPPNVDLLKIDIPSDATIDTPWRTTIISRHKRYKLVPPARPALSEPGQLKKAPTDVKFEENCDIVALTYQRMISVTPLRVNATADCDLDQLQTHLDTSVESQLILSAITQNPAQ
jgi:5'-nucleotidase